MKAIVVGASKTYVAVEDASTLADAKTYTDERTAYAGLNTYGVSWDESADTYSRTGSLLGQLVSQTLSAIILELWKSLKQHIRC